MTAANSSSKIVDFHWCSLHVLRNIELRAWIPKVFITKISWGHDCCKYFIDCHWFSLIFLACSWKLRVESMNSMCFYSKNELRAWTTIVFCSSGRCLQLKSHDFYRSGRCLQLKNHYFCRFATLEFVGFSRFWACHMWNLKGRCSKSYNSQPKKAGVH